MPTARLSMRKIRDVLHLRHAQGLTERVIVRMVGISNGVAHGYLRRARLAGLSWPLPEELDDEAPEFLLFPAPSTVDQASRPVPDWAHTEKELRRRDVTRMLLWEECRASHPDGFAYTWFCTTYEAWKGRVRPSMRQTHVAGYTFGIFDPLTGEARSMKLFVATLGASNYTYAEACASESLPDWIGVHANLFAFLGVLSLARNHDRTRIDAACRRGILIKARSVGSIPSILQNGLDKTLLGETPEHEPPTPTAFSSSAKA